uniref:RNA-directed DNA polymerase n=1 Tax=Cajanus cajan TaxID=3821 RepID=A0A151UCZ5_CAJCA
MQVSMNNQKNTEASIKNLEVQVGQLAKQLADMSGGPFSANTKTNPKEHCQSITTRSGKVVERNKDENVNKKEESEKEKEQEKNGVEKEKNKKKGKEVISTVPIKDLPYPHAPSKKEKERQFARFLDIIKKLQINIPFTEAMEQMPTYARFMKDLLTKKRRILEEETVELEAGCSAIIQKSLPQKSRDPGSFTLPVSIGNLSVGKALLDLGASINLMPLSMLKKIGDVEVRPTRMTLQLADRSVKFPHGIVEDMIVKVDKFMFPVDFVVMDMEEDTEVPLILGRPFMKTARVIIDMDDGKLKVRVHDDEVNFNVFEAMKFPKGTKECFRVDVLDDVYLKAQGNLKSSSPLEKALFTVDEECDEMLDKEVQDVIESLNKGESSSSNVQLQEELKKEEKEQPVKLELKQLPSQLKYVFLENDGGKPIIISNQLSKEEEDKLVQVIRENESAIGWTLADLKGISPSYCMHKIHMEQDYKPVAQPQRRLNPTMKEVVRKEVVKLLEAGMICPISDSAWVSPVQVVPKMGGMTVVKNEKNELIPTRTVTGWRMCIDYRKLNQATRKDHFPLPFMDQMLERLAGQSYYCFLDGYSGYNQIAVDPQDQEKTAFTCPFGVFAYRRMPFGLCNAPATFQRCMLAIFADLIEKCIEVFMDDFSVFGSFFDLCLKNLDIVLKRCVETNLVLNWEKCHFMVTEGIVLGHKISAKGIEVDPAKVEVIAKLPPPINVKGIRSFLGHAGFYRRFIKDFSKIAKPLSNLLVKNSKFDFDDECLKAFDLLKKNLVSAPIITAPDWKYDFELMCDASDYAIGAALGQRKDKIFHIIHYASKVLNETQVNYATNEKELLAIVYALEKFRPYLVGSKITVFTDHAAIKYLLTKADSKPRLIRWILLLQEFDLEIKDKKGCENHVADHLSRLVNEKVTSQEGEVSEEFPDEKLFAISERPWFADMANYKAA